MLREDEDSLRRMIGMEPDRLPPEILKEYMVRIRMYHMNGHSGPLGTIGLIDMLRAKGYGPKAVAEKVADIDWSRVSTRGEVEVEALVEDKWLKGVYKGLVDGGVKLGILLDGEEWQREFGRKSVRICRKKTLEEELAAVGGHPVRDCKPGDALLVFEDGDHKDALFQKIKDGKVVAVLKGEGKGRSFDPDKVTVVAVTA